MMPLVIAVVIAVLTLMAVLIAVLGAVLSGSGIPSAACPPPPATGTPRAGGGAADIPPTYLRLYLDAGTKYQIGWNVLAAVGEIESDHGRGTAPGIRSGTNLAGAAGPMQFMPGTWAAFGVDGDHDGRKEIYNPADAIPAAARYLRHNGAPARLRSALLHYNRSSNYVDRVTRQARAYTTTGPRPEPVAPSTGSCAAPGSVPAVPPAGPAAARAIAYAHAQLGKPYAWGAAGPSAFDCSGLTHAAYHAAGITIPRVSGAQWRHGPRIPHDREQPGDLVFFNSGPGTSTNNPGHVGLVIGGGKMIAAPHTGTVVQIQSYRHRAVLGFTRPTAHQQTHNAPQGPDR
ncbi:C40 family peptidase [Actinomadura roseirufa]|uniref:C40 family peptidase n=1 Tax=Actinomadura roseirufa TaxID=2094049 RepID=UPI0010412911|nr:lytic transglycosylase domain-containing protein [Actinomadura roseirufa]